MVSANSMMANTKLYFSACIQEGNAISTTTSMFLGPYNSTRLEEKPENKVEVNFEMYIADREATTCAYRQTFSDPLC